MRASTGESTMLQSHSPAAMCQRVLLSLSFAALSGCTALGSMMSPYSEKFSCKNSDHGQCVHPEKAWADAVAGRPSKSDPMVTNDRKLLTPDQIAATVAPPVKKVRADKAMKLGGRADTSAPITANSLPRTSIAEISTPTSAAATPMLKPSRTLRTLILPYADRQRPDRLYMARYVYSIIDRPAWVVGDYLVEPVGHAPAPPVLRSTRDKDGVPADMSQADNMAPALLSEPRP